MGSGETSTTSILQPVVMDCGHKMKMLRMSRLFLKILGPCDACWHDLREVVELVNQARHETRDKKTS